MEKLWRLREVADSFGLDYSTLWRWSKEGRINVIKLPSGILRVKDSEVRRVLGETQREPVTA